MEPPAPKDRLHRLVAHLRDSSVLWKCLERLAGLGLPTCYLGAECVTQTVRNAAHGQAPEANISDYDVVYFDASDPTAVGENEATARVRNALADLRVAVDVKEPGARAPVVPAAVRLRHHSLTSRPKETQDAIPTWPMTATADRLPLLHGRPSIFAPHRVATLLTLMYLRDLSRWIPSLPPPPDAPWVTRRTKYGELCRMMEQARIVLSGPYLAPLMNGTVRRYPKNQGD